MRISFCHHLSLSYYGGGEKWLIGLANYLSDRGHIVSIYSTPLLLDGKPKVKPLSLLDEYVHYEETWHKNVKADIVYEIFSPLNWVVFRSSRPKIAGLHSQALFNKTNVGYGLLPQLSIALNKTNNRQLARFDAVHTLTSAYPVKHKRVYTIPNFVDSGFYHPHSLKASNFTVGYASRKVTQKGYDTWKEVKKRFTDVNFVESGGLSEAEMLLFYSRCDLILAPSRVDTFGLSLVEASLCGVPVATTRLPAHLLLGIPFRYADTVEEYVKVINEMRESGFTSFGVEARKAAMRYDSARVLPELEAMFKEVAENG